MSVPFRKELSNQEDYKIAWGDDHIVGLFIQVYNPEGKCIVDRDQTRLFKSDKPLKIAEARKILKEYSQEALDDFNKYMLRRH